MKYKMKYKMKNKIKNKMKLKKKIGKKIKRRAGKKIKKKKIKKILKKKKGLIIVSKKKKKKTPSLKKAVRFKFRPLLKAYGNFRERRITQRLKEEEKKITRKGKATKSRTKEIKRRAGKEIKI